METTIEQLREYWNLMKTYYAAEHKKMKLLDATDRGELWKAIGAKFPSYQILPDSNFISYVKTNILASIYTVEKSASVLPTSENDKDFITNLNVALDALWNTENIGYYQFQAGERAALLNVGYTQVGWNDSLISGSGDSLRKGGCVLKNIDPIKFMRDPFAIDLDTAGYCCTYDNYHKSIFLEDSRYADPFRAYAAKNTDKTEVIPNMNYGRQTNPTKDYYTLIIFWVREGKDVHEIHTINAEEILYQKENIKPAMFPIAPLYCNNPAGALVGSSEPSKIFANNVAYNLMSSIALTAEYKNQRPPKFISSQSGLNVQSFNKYGNEADHTFIVNGPADKSVHYHQFPYTSAQLPMLADKLERSIETVTGVDGRYTGRDTGSIITTGGTEEMLNRVTTIDTPKIIGYEHYTKRLTQLIVSNLREYGGKRKFFLKKPNSTKWESVEVDFDGIDAETVFNYQVSISSELPKNKQRIAAMANMMMEKQMQYGEGGGVQLITEEEWLMFQDIPMKEYMLERMGVQRQQDALEEVSQTLFGYSELVKKGLNPEDAMTQVANMLMQKRMGQGPMAPPVPSADPGMMMQQPPAPGPTGTFG